MERRKKIKKITTGSSNFDTLLCKQNISLWSSELTNKMFIEGGVESMGITEAFGEFRTGKT
jgi:RecA/RadA recombinase